MPFQVTLTLERVLLKATIEADMSLRFHGVIREVGTGRVVREFTEDVTPLLDATDQQALDHIKNRAIQWVNNKDT